MPKLFTLKFPEKGHTIWDFVDLHFVLKKIANQDYTTRTQAVRSATAYIAKDKTKAIKSVTVLTLRGDDALQLLSIGPRGGVKVLWTFGDVTEAREAMILEGKLERHMAF